MANKTETDESCEMQVRWLRALLGHARRRKERAEANRAAEAARAAMSHASAVMAAEFWARVMDVEEKAVARAAKEMREIEEALNEALGREKGVETR